MAVFRQRIAQYTEFGFRTVTHCKFMSSSTGGTPTPTIAAEISECKFPTLPFSENSI